MPLPQMEKVSCPHIVPSKADPEITQLPMTNPVVQATTNFYVYFYALKGAVAYISREGLKARTLVSVHYVRWLFL